MTLLCLASAAQAQSARLGRLTPEQALKQIEHLESRDQVCAVMRRLPDSTPQQLAIFGEGHVLTAHHFVLSIKRACISGTFPLRPWNDVDEKCREARAVVDDGMFDFSAFINRNKWIRVVSVSCIQNTSLHLATTHQLITIHNSNDIMICAEVGSVLRLGIFGADTVGIVANCRHDPKGPVPPSSAGGTFAGAGSSITVLNSKNILLPLARARLESARFSNVEDLSLDLSNAHISGDLAFGGRITSTSTINLKDLRIDGSFNAQSAMRAQSEEQLRQDPLNYVHISANINAEGLRLGGAWRADKSHFLGALLLNGAHFGGDVFFSDAEIGPRQTGILFPHWTGNCSTNSTDGSQGPGIVDAGHIQMRGAQFTNGAQFERTRFNSHIHARAVHFVGGADFSASCFLNGASFEYATIDRSLTLSSATIHPHQYEESKGNENVVTRGSAINLARATVEYIRIDSARIHGTFHGWLLNARSDIAINNSELGTVYLETARLANLHIHKSTIHGDVKLTNGVHATGDINIYENNRIDGNINAGLIKADKGMNLAYNKQWKGNFELGLGKVAIDVDLSGSEFIDPGHCKGAASYDCLSIKISDTDIGQPLIIENVRAPLGVNIRRVKVGNDIRLGGSEFGKSVDLTQSTFGVLWTRPNHCDAPPPKNAPFVKDGEMALAPGSKLVLAGAKFTYLAIGGKAAYAYDPEKRVRLKDWAAINVSGAEYNLRSNLSCPGDLFFPGPDTDANSEKITRWISTPAISDPPSLAGADGAQKSSMPDPQPFETLAKALNDIGRKKEAEDVLKAKFDRRTDALPWSSEKVLLWLSWLFVNYGLSNEQALFWWGGLIGVGTLVRFLTLNILPYRCKKREAKARPHNGVLKEHCTFGLLEGATQVGSAAHARSNLYRAFMYSLTRAVPAGSELCRPEAAFNKLPCATRNNDPVWDDVYFVIHKLFAFVLISFAIAGMSGLIK